MVDETAEANGEGGRNGETGRDSRTPRKGGRAGRRKATLRLCLFSDDDALVEALQDGCPPPHKITQCPFDALYDESDAGQDQLQQALARADVVLLEWDVLHARLVDQLSHKTRWHSIPLVALCRAGEHQQVTALVAGADLAMEVPLSFALLEARLLAWRRALQAEREVARIHFEVEQVAAQPAQVEGDGREKGASPVASKALHLDREAQVLYVRGQAVRLTPRQFTLLACFMQHPHKTLSREKLLEQVWGIDYEPGSNTVDVYVHYLRDVLKKCGLRSVIMTIHGRGYRFTPPEES